MRISRRGVHQRAVVVRADQPRATHLSLAQDAGVDKARDLAVHGRVGQAGPFGQIGDAQLVTGEQQRGEQARLAVRPEDRGEERRLGSHITDIILQYIDSQRAGRSPQKTGSPLLPRSRSA
jgi:hypothetical protein